MIWYSHVNEDNRVEREVALAGSFQRVFCIAGSGERVISLIDVPGVTSIHAIDVNLDALRLLELKLLALTSLEPDQYLRFCGFDEDTRESRTRTWNAIKGALRMDARRFWEDRTALISSGIANLGHFERFLGRIRPFALAFLGRGFGECWVREPESFARFPWRRWRILASVFSRRFAHVLAGNRDPAFVTPGVRSAAIGRSLNDILNQAMVPHSFIWHLIFRGHVRNMAPEALPPSIRPDLLPHYRSALAEGRVSISLQHGDLLEELQALDADLLSNALFSVSDLLSFCDFSYVRELLDLLDGRRSTVVMRSFLRNRLTPAQREYLRGRCAKYVDRTDRESTRMYEVHELVPGA